MRILSGGLIYDFTVSSTTADDGDVGTPNELTVKFRFIKRNVESNTQQRCFQVPRVGGESAAAIMSDLLGEHEVPSAAKSDMAAHFGFHLDRLNRMNHRGAVEVKLEAAAVSSARAEMMQNRLVTDANNRNRNRFLLRRVREEETEVVPADKKAVAALERRVIDGDEEEERECAICLERLEIGVEVIKMPCSHVYHYDCIIRWLDKNHFCPFCRFKLPC